MGQYLYWFRPLRSSLSSFKHKDARWGGRLKLHTVLCHCIKSTKLSSASYSFQSVCISLLIIHTWSSHADIVPCPVSQISKLHTNLEGRLQWITHQRYSALHLPYPGSKTPAKPKQWGNTAAKQTHVVSHQYKGCPEFQEKHSVYSEINYCRSISTRMYVLYFNYFTACDAVSCAIKLFVYQASEIAGCRKAIIAYCV